MRLQTIPEAARALGMSAQQLRRRVQAGHYPHYEVGGRVMVDVDELARIVEMERGSIGIAEAAQLTGLSMKADVASSEGANNVELAILYNDACPYQTPPQQENSAIRQGIDGFPCVIFWTDGYSTTFLGKYNFNNDKGTEEVFGFESGDESWEIKNNTSDRVLWKSADYTGDGWLNDFEARYPDTDPAYEDATNLAALAAWLVSTDRTQATGDALSETYTDADGNTHTLDNAAYRLAKFKTEAPDHFEMQSALFYYIFTELFLMVDSRAKNAFPTRIGGSKWAWLPYDFDTALGINNEGALVFGYSLEDTDTLTGGADVFNGQQSVMWCNLRDTFGAEIKAMYQTLRSTGVLSYSRVETAFEQHQAKWGEAIFNEDAWFKYLAPLIEDGSGAYLAMLQGSKAEQRKWWLYNRFRYMDSKYNAGDALSDVIQLRGYAKDDVTITPYADVYASVKFGSYLVQTRGTRNTAYTMVCPLDNVNDTEIYIYSASQLASVGDLSGLKVGFADFSMATKLSQIKLGDSAGAYDNANLKELYLGNNTLLKTLDARNCSGLGTGDMKSVDISGCTGIENVYFDGTAITGLELPNGGVLRVLHLPGTITNLTIRNTTYTAVFQAPQVWFDEEITDSWDTIISKIAAGTANYKPGNYKPLDLGAQGIVNMQIVAEDADALAAGGGTAKYSWISKELLKDSHRWNPSYSSGTDGTGTLGGWELSELRSYLKNTIKPLIPSNVRTAIKEVTKYTRIYQASPEQAVANVATTEDVWIPGRNEMFGNYSGESNSPYYSSAFPDNASRVKKNVSTGSAAWWWLRSAGTDYANYVTSVGSYYYYAVYYSGGVALGFCM